MQIQLQSLCTVWQPSSPCFWSVKLKFADVQQWLIVREQVVREATASSVQSVRRSCLSSPFSTWPVFGERVGELFVVI